MEKQINILMRMRTWWTFLKGTLSLVDPEELENGGYDFFIFIFLSYGHCSVMVHEKSKWILWVFLRPSNIDSTGGHYFISPTKVFFFNFNFLLLFNYSCVPFLPIPPPHPSWTRLPPSPPPSPLILCIREKEGAYTLCNSMDGTGEHYVKWNKPDGEGQIPYDLTFNWNIINRRKKETKCNQRHWS